MAELKPRPEGFPEVGDDEEERQAKRFLMLASEAMISQDGSRLLWVFNGLQLFDISSGKKLDTFAMDSQHIHRMSTSRDGEWLLAAAYDDGPKAVLLNLRQRSVYGELRLTQSRNGSRVRISPDAHTFAVVNDQPERAIDVYETATMQRRLSIPTQSGVAEQIEFSPSGRYLAAAHTDGTVLVYDLRGRP